MGAARVQTALTQVLRWKQEALIPSVLRWKGRDRFRSRVIQILALQQDPCSPCTPGIQHASNTAQNLDKFLIRVSI